MTTMPTAPSRPSPETGGAAKVAAALHWLRDHRGAVVVAGLLAFAGPLTFLVGAISVLQWLRAAEIAQLAAWWTLYGTVLWAALIVGGQAAERFARAGTRPRRGALQLVAASAAALTANLLTAGRAGLLLETGLVHSVATMHLHGFVFSLTMALLYFAHLRRNRAHEQAVARLAAAQMAQREARRRMVEARLQALQARIDPQLLFEMLDALRGLYAKDPARAEQFLDRLIAFLRNALPRLRTASSSLLRETALAGELVCLRALAGSHDGRLQIDVAPEVRHARFPSGVLLPLLERATDRPFRLAAQRSDRACCVLLSLGSAPSESAIARVARLLAEIYGTAAALRVERGDSSDTVIVMVPYEFA